MIRMAIPRWEWYARLLVRAAFDGLVLVGCVVVGVLAALALT
jgi:hypothetical protein